MAKKYPIYIAGSFQETSTEFSVTCPYDNREVGTTFLAGKEELEKAILAAQQAANDLRNMPSYKRYEALMQIAEKLVEERDSFAETLALEAGKPLTYARGEVDRATQVFRVAAEEAKRLPREYFSIDWTAAGSGKEGLVKYMPIGPIAAIAPFNFPLNLAVHKLAPALAAGNPVVLKPARSTPLSVLKLARLVQGTDFPQGALSVLPMDREAGNQLVTDERFAMLSFTGSPEVGWKMKAQAGKKKVALELGGNAGVIVTPTADLKLAVQKCLAGGFAYSGQVCIHVQRIQVQEQVFDTFVDAFVDATAQLRTGAPDKEEVQFSGMIDEANAKRVETWVNEAKSQGALVLHGGQRQGAYYAPTVLTQTDSVMKVCAKEVFGPVVVIEKYNHFQAALDYINNSPYGLQAGVFTNQLDEMDKAFNGLEVGGVIINDVPAFRVDHMPYGGVKESGFGREGVKYAIQEMMEPRLLVKNVSS
ncbi:MAG: aldehyde dehydrogenase family protein [Bacteroidales bacterium]